MSKRSPLNDPVGTIRRDESRGALFYAIRWHENPDMGWRIINVVSGGDQLASNVDVRDWTVLYRPAAVMVQA